MPVKKDPISRGKIEQWDRYIQILDGLDILELLQKLELPPRVLLGVEDSPSGVQSAHAAGMMVAMVPDQDQPSAEIAALCALVAPSLAGIAPFVKESLRRL